MGVFKWQVPLDRLELSLLAPEANALSTELQGHKDFYFTMIYFRLNLPEFVRNIRRKFEDSSSPTRSAGDQSQVGFLPALPRHMLDVFYTLIQQSTGKTGL